MNWLDSVRTAWDALAANKLRSALTMLGMVIGVTAVAAIISIGRGASDSVKEQLNALGNDMFRLNVGFGPMPEPEGGLGRMVFMDEMQFFSESDLDKLRRHIPDAQYVTTTNWASGQVNIGGEERWFSVQGVFPEFAEMMGLRVSQGRFFNRDEFDTGAPVAVLFRRTLDQIMPGEPNPIGSTVKIEEKVYTLIGVFDEDSGAAARWFTNTDGAVVPFSTVKKNSPWPQPIQDIMVKVRPGSNLDAAGALSKEFLETIHPGMFVDYWSPRSIQDTQSGVTDTVSKFAAAIAAISLLVGGVGIMNIMLVSVAERTREIGLRKALGATDEAVLVQFLVEALVTGVTGGMIGLMLALGPVHVAGKWLQYPIGIAVDTIALALGFSGLIGLIFGVYPALKAARLDPIEALRQE